MTEQQPVLDVTGLNVSYMTPHGNLAAVTDVNLRVDRGEVVAIVGESGSGKSTVAAAVTRLLPGSACVDGRVNVLGRAVYDLPPSAVRRLLGRDIGFVPQDPTMSLDPLARVGVQAAAALRIHGQTTRRAAKQRGVELLDEVGIRDAELRARHFPHQLSGGMRQRVLIAAALACRPPLVIADEPTSALDVTVQAKILDLLQTMSANHGSAVVLITHDLAVAADRADRIAVMKAGRIVEQGTVREILGSPTAAYTKALLAAAPALGPVTARRAAVHAGDDGEATALTVDGLGKRYLVPGRRRASDVFAGVQSVSFRIPAGRTMALVGESGSGKSTIARLVCRLLEPDHGRVLLGDTDLSNAKGERLRDLRRRIQLVHQSTQASLDPRMNVGRSIREPLDSFRIGRRGDRDRQVAELLDHVALPSSILRRQPRELSGGQRQRVIIARALALSPSVVVLDEPVSALDVSVQAQILALLRRLQSELDLSYLFISHDLAVVRDIADSVAVMQDGRIVEHGPTEHVFCMPSTAYTEELIASVPGQRSRVTRDSNLPA